MEKVRFSETNDSVILASGFYGDAAQAEMAVDALIEDQPNSDFIERSGQAPDYDETTDTFYFAVKHYE